MPITHSTAAGAGRGGREQRKRFRLGRHKVKVPDGELGSVVGTEREKKD